MTDRKLSDEIAHAATQQLNSGTVVVTPCQCAVWADRVAKLESDRDRLREERDDVESALVSAGIDAPNDLNLLLDWLRADQNRTLTVSPGGNLCASQLEPGQSARGRHRYADGLGELVAALREVTDD